MSCAALGPGSARGLRLLLDDAAAGANGGSTSLCDCGSVGRGLASTAPNLRRPAPPRSKGGTTAGPSPAPTCRGCNGGASTCCGRLRSSPPAASRGGDLSV